MKHQLPPKARQLLGLLNFRLRELRQLEYGIELNGRRTAAIRKKLEEMGVQEPIL